MLVGFTLGAGVKLQGDCLVHLVGFENDLGTVDPADVLNERRLAGNRDHEGLRSGLVIRRLLRWLAVLALRRLGRRPGGPAVDDDLEPLLGGVALEEHGSGDEQGHIEGLPLLHLDRVLAGVTLLRLDRPIDGLAILHHDRFLVVDLLLGPDSACTQHQHHEPGHPRPASGRPLACQSAAVRLALLHSVLPQ